MNEKDTAMRRGAARGRMKGHTDDVHRFDQRRLHPIFPARLAPPGAPVAAALQPPDERVDVFFVGRDRHLYIVWEDNGKWHGPASLGTGPSPLPVVGRRSSTTRAGP